MGQERTETQRLTKRGVLPEVSRLRHDDFPQGQRSEGSHLSGSRLEPERAPSAKSSLRGPGSLIHEMTLALSPRAAARLGGGTLGARAYPGLGGQPACCCCPAWDLPWTCLPRWGPQCPSAPTRQGPRWLSGWNSGL